MLFFKQIQRTDIYWSGLTGRKTFYVVIGLFGLMENVSGTLSRKRPFVKTTFTNPAICRRTVNLQANLYCQFYPLGLGIIMIFVSDYTTACLTNVISINYDTNTFDHYISHYSWLTVNSQTNIHTVPLHCNAELHRTGFTPKSLAIVTLNHHLYNQYTVIWYNKKVNSQKQHLNHVFDFN